MLDFQVSLHVFMSVLILGTIFRLVSYHLMASSNPGVQHIGKAMSTQYLSMRQRVPTRRNNCAYSN